MSVHEQREVIFKRLESMGIDKLELVMDAINVIDNKDSKDAEIVQIALDIIKNNSSLLQRLAQ
jgi:hypothetical protein